MSAGTVRLMDALIEILKRIADETGEYEKGDMVFLDPHSVHTPRALGETLVLVLWPGGVRLVD